MIPELVSCLERSVAFMEELVADLSDEDMVLQPRGAPNHPAWTLGHIIHSCHAIAGELGNEAWLPADWESRFGFKSTPRSETATGANKAELLAALSDASQRLRSALLRADEELLAGPLPDEKARALFPTTGHALLQVVAAHTAYHAGQLAAWRRTIGKPPVGVFL